MHICKVDVKFTIILIRLKVVHWGIHNGDKVDECELQTLLWSNFLSTQKSWQTYISEWVKWWWMTYWEWACYLSSIEKLTPLRMPKWVWPLMSQYKKFFVQSSIPTSSMHYTLTKNGKHYMQDNKLSTNTLVGINDYNIMWHIFYHCMRMHNTC